MKHLLLTIAALGTLAGCATSLPYPEVPEANSAKLRLRMQEPFGANAFLQAIDAEKCAPAGELGWLTGGVDALYQQHRVNMLDQKPPREGTLQYRIAAGKPFAARIAFQTAKLSTGQIIMGMAFPLAAQAGIQAMQPASCSAVPVLVPRADEEYEIAYRMGPGLCEMVIYRLSTGSDGVVARTDITRDSNLVVTGATPKEYSCKPPQATAAAPAVAR